MNKITLSMLTITLSLSVFSSQAVLHGDSLLRGGFQGPSARQIIYDVVSALNASDDTQVELTGHIVFSISQDYYIFRDTTGDIKIEIDDELWRGNIVTPETLVIILGEVDKDWSEVTIDADSIQIVQ